MKVAIIGAGVAGLTAAHVLQKAGHQVLVYEAAAHVGGLASGFRDAQWEWPLERFYHHIFTSDTAIRALVDEIGLSSNLIYRRPITAQWWHGRGYPLTGGPAPLGLPLPAVVTGALATLAFPAMPLLDRLRLLAVLAYLKYGVRDWRPLERVTATDWTRRWVGPRAWRAFIQPLVEGKFGPHADDVNMAWLWSRFKARSVELGYFEGGFQAFADALAQHVQSSGAHVVLNTPITALIALPTGEWRVVPAGDSSAVEVDRVIVTGSPRLLARLAPQMPPTYLERVTSLRSMGAVVLTIALRHPLTHGLYWINLPKDQFPFLALVEHTSFISSAHYGGDHLVYCGDYLDPDHEYFRLSAEELLERFLPALQSVNPRCDRSWVRAYWLHREPYAQPIVPVNHSQSIPSLQTPLPGLYWASMSQVYPWDRGTNFAVELGQNVARLVSASASL